MTFDIDVIKNTVISAFESNDKKETTAWTPDGDFLVSWSWRSVPSTSGYLNAKHMESGIVLAFEYKNDSLEILKEIEEWERGLGDDL